MEDFQAAFQLVLNGEFLSRVFVAFHSIRHENVNTQGYAEEAEKINKFKVMKAALRAGIEKGEIICMNDIAIDNACETLKKRLKVVARLALK